LRKLKESKTSWLGCHEDWRSGGNNRGRKRTVHEEKRNDGKRLRLKRGRLFRDRKTFPRVVGGGNAEDLLGRGPEELKGDSGGANKGLNEDLRKETLGTKRSIGASKDLIEFIGGE